MKFKFAGIGKFTSVEDALREAHDLSCVCDEDLDKFLPGASILSQEEVTSENWSGVPYSYFEGEVDVPLVRSVFEFEGVDDEDPCETCGWSPEEGTLWITEVGNVLATRYGCYGGVLYSSIRQPGAKTEQQIQDELDYIQGFMKGPFDKAWAALNMVR